MSKNLTQADLDFMNKYIPKKYHEAIEDMETGYDGYWVTVKEGYTVTSTDSHTIHEYTIKDLKKQFKYIEKEEDVA